MTGDDDGHPNRRQLLGTLGASALALGVAGCTSGADDGTEEPGDDGTGEPNDEGAADTPDDEGGGECTPGHTEGDPPCRQVEDDATVLTGFDAAGTLLAVTFDYPCGWRGSTTDQFDDRAQANATRDGIGGDDGAYVDVQVRTYYQPVGEGYLDAETEQGNYETVDYEYDGETRTGLVSAESTAQFGTTGHTVVPFRDSLVHVELVSTLHADDCDVEPRPDYGLVEAMLRSIEPNQETTFSPEGTATPPKETQQVVENDVGGLEVVDHEGSVTDENYSVTVTVENTGDQVTDVEEYDFRVDLYDAAGAEIDGAGGLVWGQEGDLAPGEQIEIRIESTVEDGADPEDVARYQVRVECGTFSEGVYCED